MVGAEARPRLGTLIKLVVNFRRPLPSALLTAATLNHHDHDADFGALHDTGSIRSRP